MTDFCMYFQTFGMGILAELHVRFLSFLLFCTEVPMVDRKMKWFIAWSPLHRVQVPGGTQIWVGQGCDARASKPLPILKGGFGRKLYPVLRIFIEK